MGLALSRGLDPITFPQRLLINVIGVTLSQEYLTASTALLKPALSSREEEEYEDDLGELGGGQEAEGAGFNLQVEIRNSSTGYATSTSLRRRTAFPLYEEVISCDQ